MDEDLDAVQDKPWRAMEDLVIVGGVVIIAMRIKFPHLLTAGDILALLFIPAWVPYVRRYSGARGLIGLGIAAALAGIGLTFAQSDHGVGLGLMLNNTMLLLGFVVSFGFLVWARHRVGTASVVVFFGVGLLVGLDRSSPLFSQGPWKHGYSLGTTLVVLGIAQLIRNRGVELVFLFVLCGISAITDSRSQFAILLLVAALVAWQARPLQVSRKGSAFRGMLGLAAAAAVVYNVGQALILHGFLGAATQQRSVAQINEAGNLVFGALVVGGRPEIAATLAMMRDHIWGYGSGTRVNFHDLTVAKTGMASIHYDPNNGYVENYMFGSTYELHSVIGDGWARYGLVGLALVALMTFLVCRWLGRSITAGTASAGLLFLAIYALWNMLFAPWYGAFSVMTVTLAVMVDLRQIDEQANVPPDLATDRATAKALTG